MLLIEHLKIKTCKVLCWSGGGPFALAIANRLPAIISVVYIVAGFSLSLETKKSFRKCMEQALLWCGKKKSWYYANRAEFLFKAGTKQRHPETYFETS
jgi:pimeloyl-ACP methyl ester carboxylesterase